MSARDELVSALEDGGHLDAAAARLINAFRAEVLAELEAAEPRATEAAVMTARRAIHAANDGPVPAEPEAAPTTVFRASHDSIDMGLYTNRQAAYEHCEAYELRDDPVSPMVWHVDEDGVAELFRIRVPRSPGAESATGYVVTAVEVATSYDPDGEE